MNLLPPAPDRTVPQRFAYAVCRGLVVLAGKLGWVVRIYDSERVPLTGPVILAPTHRSLLDIPFIGFVTARPARFMAKAELFKRRAVGKFLTELGGFPVKRGTADRSALTAAVAALESGAPLVIFPEGTRRSGPTIDRIEEGVAYIALKTGAPVVPIGVAGTEAIRERGRRIPFFSKVIVAVGNPIQVDRVQGRLDRVEVAAVVDEIRAGLQQEFDRARAILEQR